MRYKDLFNDRLVTLQGGSCTCRLISTCRSPTWHVMPWASCQIRKIAGCACAGNAGNVFPRRRLQRKPLVSDPGMHHGTCVTHVPWCMSGSFNCGDGENVPGIPGACAPAILRIWQEAHECYCKRRHEPNKTGLLCLVKTCSPFFLTWVNFNSFMDK